MNPFNTMYRILTTWLIGGLAFSASADSTLETDDLHLGDIAVPSIKTTPSIPEPITPDVSINLPDGEPDKDTVVLDPVIVRPFDSVTEQFTKLFNDERLHFLTRKGVAAELVTSLIPEWDRLFLNRWTLPFFGISNEERAYQLARERYLLKTLDRNQRILESRRLSDPDYYRQNRDLQLELFKMAQQARTF